MLQGNFFNYCGKIFKNNEPVISPANRSFRYGDGFFETMKMLRGKIVLEALHFERLFTSLAILQFQKPEYFTKAFLLQQVKIVAEKNNHIAACMVRINIFRGEGGLYDSENNEPNFIIETRPIRAGNNTFSDKDFAIDIYSVARKSCDEFSNIKSNNYLAYIMAAGWAKKNNLQDALVLNAFERIADATIANVFIVKGKNIFTPALSEGCINGVMRKYLLQCFTANKILFKEVALGVDEMAAADEIFLTNAGYGICPVKKFRKKDFACNVSRQLYQRFILPLYNV